MNKKGINLLILSGFIIGIYIFISAPNSYVDTSKPEESLVNTYYEALDEETKKAISSDDAIVEEESNDNIKRITVRSKNGNIISETIIEKITVESAIQNSMDIDGISYDEAKDLVESKMDKVRKDHSLTKDQAEESMKWQTISNDKTFDFAGSVIKTRLSGDFLLYEGGDGREINDVKSISHRVINSETVTLESVNPRPMTTGFPSPSGIMKSDAVLAITTNNTVGLSLKEMGFDISASIGGDFICRKPITHSYIYSAN